MAWNYANDCEDVKAAADMTSVELDRMRRWPAHLTTEQKRQQIEWEQSPAFRRVRC